MIASDAVLTAGGDVFHLLSHIRRQLSRRNPGTGEPATELEAAGDRLRQASRGLYAARQIMRRDLGITELPAERPATHGAIQEEQDR